MLEIDLVMHPSFHVHNLFLKQPPFFLIKYSVFHALFYHLPFTGSGTVFYSLSEILSYLANRLLLRILCFFTSILDIDDTPSWSRINSSCRRACGSRPTCMHACTLQHACSNSYWYVFYRFGQCIKEELKLKWFLSIYSLHTGKKHRLNNV